MAKKTALNKDPKVTNTKSGPPDVARMERRVQYLERTRPNDRSIAVLKRKIAKAGPSQGAAAGGQQQSFSQLPIKDQMNQMGDTGGGIFQQMGGYASQFNPNTFQQQYDPIYSQEMERARNDVMEQFDRRNKQQIEQQRLSTQQQIAERGLDPASPAAQEMWRAQNEREVLANQEAMSGAQQAAQSVQQQQYQQAMGNALLPGQIAEQYMAPVLAGYGQYGQEQLQRMQNKQRQWEVQHTPRGGGGGGGGRDPYAAFNQYVAGQMMSGYGPQQQQPNPWASAANGFAAGFGQGLGAGLMK